MYNGEGSQLHDTYQKLKTEKEKSELLRTYGTGPLTEVDIVSLSTLHQYTLDKIHWVGHSITC